MCGAYLRSRLHPLVSLARIVDTRTIELSTVSTIGDCSIDRASNAALALLFLPVRGCVRVLKDTRMACEARETPMNTFDSFPDGSSSLTVCDVRILFRGKMSCGRLAISRPRPAPIADCDPAIRTLRALRTNAINAMNGISFLFHHQGRSSFSVLYRVLAIAVD